MSTNPILDALTREGVLIDVSVRYWRAAKKLRPEDLGLDPDRVTDRLISLGHKRLLPRDALAGFALIESRAHTLVEASTFPFLGGIGHFLPNAKLPEVTAKHEDLEREFNRAREDFLGRYAALRTEATREWWEAARRLHADPNRLVATIEAAFPRPEDMNRYYGFTTHLFQVKVPEGNMRLDVVQAGEQQAILEARRMAAAEAAQVIHTGAREFIGDCVATLRQETAKLCDEMLSSMRGGKTEGVHQKTLIALNRQQDGNFGLTTDGWGGHVDKEVGAKYGRLLQLYAVDKQDLKANPASGFAHTTADAPSPFGLWRHKPGGSGQTRTFLLRQEGFAGQVGP